MVKQQKHTFRGCRFRFGVEAALKNTSQSPERLTLHIGDKKEFATSLATLCRLCTHQRKGVHDVRSRVVNEDQLTELLRWIAVQTT